MVRSENDDRVFVCQARETRALPGLSDDRVYARHASRVRSQGLPDRHSRYRAGPEGRQQSRANGLQAAVGNDDDIVR